MKSTKKTISKKATDNMALVKVNTSKAVVKTTATASAARRDITSDCIASRAYSLWENAGRPQGRDMEFWFQAEQQLQVETRAMAA
jgi:hypothetical protein